MAQQSLVDARQVVMDLFSAFGRGDREEIRRLLAEDVDWVVPGDEEIMPWAGRFRGAQAVLEAMSGNAGATQDLRITTKWAMSDGEKAVFLINEQATVAGTGKFYEVDSVHVYTVRDGKVAGFINYFNPLPVLEATYGKPVFPRLAQKSTARVVKEHWTFFESGGTKYHHSETFTYDYDEQGRRLKGRLDNPFRNVSYDMIYRYDENGRGTGEEWVNTADAGDVYVLTYEYADAGDLITGGKGAGRNTWEFAYEYDGRSRKAKMTNRYSNGNAWVFVYTYDEAGNCVLGQGTATNGLSCTIIYEYERTD